MSGANLFKHMAIYNVDGHGVSSGVSARGGSYLSNHGLSVTRKEGEIKKSFLGWISDGGPKYVVEDRGELEAGEDLGLVSGPTKLHVEKWTGLGKNI
ncbi:hypothetical protein Ancab_037739 [Ancistrocladus abbreviatus]